MGFGFVMWLVATMIVRKTTGEATVGTWLVNRALRRWKP